MTFAFNVASGHWPWSLAPRVPSAELYPAPAGCDTGCMGPRGRRWQHVLLAVALAAGAGGAIRFIQPDPARDVVRVRIVVTSRASAVTVATADAVITNAAVERIGGGLGERPVVEGGRVGTPATSQDLRSMTRLRVTLAHVRGSRVTFQTERGGPGSVTLEVANINDDLDPQVVDRFSSHDSTASFTSSAQELREGPRLAIGEVTPRLVLAHYYPWDRPLHVVESVSSTGRRRNTPPTIPAT